MLKLLELKDEFRLVPLETFDHLNEDKYLKAQDKFRFRAYSTGNLVNSILKWKEENSSFLQSKELNNYMGDVVRHFNQLPPRSKKYINIVIRSLFDSSTIPKANYEIGCHQIRIIATDKFNGYPAPEGFHRDGFDYIAIHCAQLNNVNGAISLVRSLDNKEKLYEHILLPSQIMVLNDNKVEHYITPITPKIPNKKAYRDIFVITFNKKEIFL
ncbi:2OG-Fe dioxygenase family protein [Acinetobacter populi]|uniref:2OG-Fe dioxygenase family protein n=1 Tax=Acinetobacter populi TaxID=1582270 RepID=A0A1Z9Z1T4_9GAMM|nr:2OG-Fe dioxygenase family protein [Acinetobacter populi]OUY08441.1 hypothetical protein CAP51_02145 [Acinetobacter populi]